MDILDIIKNVVNKNESERIKKDINRIQERLKKGVPIKDIAAEYGVNSEQLRKKIENIGFDIGDQNQEKESKYNYVLQDNQIHEVISQLYKGVPFNKVAQFFQVSDAVLESELKRHNYKRRWKMKDDYGEAEKIKPILFEVNNKRRNLEEVCKQLSIDIDVVNGGIKEVWVPRSGNESVSKINGETYLFSNVDDVKFKYIVYKGVKLITSSQVNSILGINSLYYYNTMKGKFNNEHIKFIDHKTLEMINAVFPIDVIIRSSNFYTEKGIKLLASLSNKETQLQNEKFVELFGESEQENKIEERRESHKGNGSWSELREQIKGLSRNLNNKNTNDNSITSEHEPKTSQEDVDKNIERKTTDWEKVATDRRKEYSLLFDSGITEVEVKSILKMIVNELNNGETIYDISRYFTNNRKERAIYAGKLQSKLEYEGYKLNKDTKKWEYTLSNDHFSEIPIIKTSKNVNESIRITESMGEPNNVTQPSPTQNIDDSPDPESIKELVEYLNKVKSFIRVERKYDINRTSLRLLLKNNGYSYDGLFEIWTKKSRLELLKETAQKLKDGAITFEELSQQGIDVETIKEKIMEAGFEFQNIKETADQMEGVQAPIQEEGDKNVSALTIDEIKILKDIVAKQLSENITEQENNVKEDMGIHVTFKLKKSLVDELNRYSDYRQTDISIILENAIKEYLRLNDN